jgi:Na+-driven multidrug efflux pump
VTTLAGTVGPVVWLVLPVLLEQVPALSVGFVDKWLAGRRGHGRGARRDPGLGLAARGAWIAMAVDLTARGLAMLVIFMRIGWTRVLV